MSTSQEYTISRKVSDTEEEIIQIPYDALANKPDLSVYQTKNDASLATTDKTVVGAINEVNSTAGTNKTDITNIKNGTAHVGVAKKVEWVFHLSKWDGKFTGTKDYDGSKAMRLGFNTASYFELGENASGLVNGYVVELKDTGVTAGTYNNVTVDSKGRVTSGESKDYALKRDIPAKVTSVDGLGGGTISGNVSTTGNLTVGGNLTVNGTTTTVDSTTLQVKDKLIEVAHGNTTKLTTPAGLVAPKYDGTNSGALVFDSTGTAYVGDVKLDSTGNIDVAKSELQPLATRTGLVGGNLVQYDSTAQTLKDSGKKISDLALTSQLPTVNNGTLTIQKNGTNVQTFTANQSTNATANITVPTKVSELTNDSGYTTNNGTITGIKMNGASKGTSGVVDLGTVLTAHQDISGKQDKITSSNKLAASLVSGLATVATSGSYNDLSNTPTIPDISGKQDKLTAGSNITISGNTISATVPTKTSQLTNDSNFVKSNSGTFTGNLTADNFNSRFSLQSVPYGTAVGENADLNTATYLSVGNYYCGADAIVSTMTNVPVKRAFMMTVYSPLTPTVDNETTGKWVYRVRKFMTYLGEEYIQSVYSGNTAGTFTYGAWQQIAHKSDIPTMTFDGTTLTINL